MFVKEGAVSMKLYIKQQIFSWRDRFEVKEENAYEPTYITPGLPVKMNVEKGAWFKIGVSVQNDTNTDQTVYVEVEDVVVRIE